MLYTLPPSNYVNRIWVYLPFLLFFQESVVFSQTRMSIFLYLRVVVVVLTSESFIFLQFQKMSQQKYFFISSRFFILPLCFGHIRLSAHLIPPGWASLWLTSTLVSFHLCTNFSSFAPGGFIIIFIFNPTSNRPHNTVAIPVRVCFLIFIQFIISFMASYTVVHPVRACNFN